MTKKKIFATLEGNEAAAYVAYRINEICIIYPITPATTMGELADQWSTNNEPNIWQSTPEVIAMQSEGGVAGALHGALQAGSLATTFTSSQGLLLMIPNMYRIAGELLPTVFHVASRVVASQGVNIYCEHSDVMATRATGFALLCSATVQEAHDMALITQAASLKSRVPFLHFFDGFRTSHEVTKIELVADEIIAEFISQDLVIANRKRRLTSDNPTVRGLVQDPDTYFQSRETVNLIYQQIPAVLTAEFKKLKQLTGREYKLVEYYGDPKAEAVIVIMGSGAETAIETVNYLCAGGKKVGVLKVRLFRPFPKQEFVNAIPATVKAMAVLDRTKEPGSAGEPLYQEVAVSLLEARRTQRVIAGRYGIAGKEFIPAMVKAIFDELAKEQPKQQFTVGVIDDVSNLSLDYDVAFDTEAQSVKRAMFYGLGADGTVSSNKNTIKIVGEETDLYVQGYFVYDAKKSGSKTVSHLRFSSEPIHSAYLVNKANFIGCHQFRFVEIMPVLERAAQHAIFLLNSSYAADKVWDRLPRSLQQTIIDKKIKFFIIDAYKIARDCDMGGHINIIMQVGFFALSGILPIDLAVQKIKAALAKTYMRKGSDIVTKNYTAVDCTLANIFEVDVPAHVSSHFDLKEPLGHHSAGFVRDVLGKILAGKGDELPISAIPMDGTYPTHTTRYEKRNVARCIPVWDAEACIQCGQCKFICPHSIIRTKKIATAALKNAPATFKTAKMIGKYLAEDDNFALQVYLEDCTGCGLCVEICPAHKGKMQRKALVMQERIPLLDMERKNIEFFESIPNEISADTTDPQNTRDLCFHDPMFEFCNACAGCGEAAYVKLLTQLFGDRLLIADACGCSIVFGGYLPMTPWVINKEGRGPAYANSLFEDNAEFGFGFLLAYEKQRADALQLLDAIAPQLNDSELINTIKTLTQRTNAEINTARKHIAKLKDKLKATADPRAVALLSIADQLVRHSIWGIGGDGWAYDIGYGGLDHVLASGRNIKILVLDTEVYSNTGGQASKATPRGAVAKFATSGKHTAKKDLGLMLMTYGNIYVGTIALGANPTQAIKVLREAENYDGPAIVIAYCHCIAHGIEMHHGLRQQQLAVKSGYWPLYRYNPDRLNENLNPFQLDSGMPDASFAEYLANENRFQILMRSNSQRAEYLTQLAEEDLQRRWRQYKMLMKVDV
jgi:pyruvate-ferredoxin/flavodoxin oxidoreductase